MNSRVVFLSSGQCPPENIKKTLKSKQCWTHPGSYLSDLGIQTKDGTRLYIQSGDKDMGFSSISFNEKSVDMNSIDSSSPIILSSESLNVTVLSSYTLVLNTEHYEFTIENSDGFINLSEAVILDWSRMVNEIQSHGILGQTWRDTAKEKAKELKELEGYVDEYAIYENNVWGYGFAYNKFHPSA